MRIDARQEIWATVERAIIENHTTDIAVLELNTLKMALNITFGDLRSVVIPAFIHHIDPKRVLFSAKEVTRFFVHF
jgi:translation initiation factor eIF-2B subunit epsilon